LLYPLARSADLAQTMSRYLIERIAGNPCIELLCERKLIERLVATWHCDHF
jgi:hypothetical protein